LIGGRGGGGECSFSHVCIIREEEEEEEGKRRRRSRESPFLWQYYED